MWLDFNWNKCTILKIPFTVFCKNKTTLNTLVMISKIHHLQESNPAVLRSAKYAAHWAVTQSFNQVCHLPPAVFPAVHLPEAANTWPFWQKSVCPIHSFQCFCLSRIFVFAWNSDKFFFSCVVPISFKDNWCIYYLYFILIFLAVSVEMLQSIKAIYTWRAAVFYFLYILFMKPPWKQKYFLRVSILDGAFSPNYFADCN